MPHAGEMSEHVHPIIDEMGHTKAFADRSFVRPLSAKMERLRIETKHIEQLVMREPKAGLFLRTRAALRYDANTPAKSFTAKARQYLERPLHRRRFKEAIREKRSV